MNTSTKLAGAGIALIIGSALAPVAASAAPSHPVRFCLDNASASQCDSVVIASSDESGAGGQEVAVRPPSSGRIDPKDHPNYGQITVEGRTDTKDHPNYGQVTVEGRTDTKDHPNYGQATPV